MKKILVFIVSATVALAAHASSTWSYLGPKSKTARVTCTTGTETLPGAGTRDGAWSAATTYSAGDYVVYDHTPWVALQGTNTNHQPFDGSTWWAQFGMDLGGMSAWEVEMCASTVGATVDSGSLVVMWFNPTTDNWSRTDYALPLPTGSHCVSTVGLSPAWGMPITYPYGRFAVLPSSATFSSGAGSVTTFGPVNTARAAQ